MLTDRENYKEEGYIGEELFQNPAYELERQCMTVESTVKRKIFTLPEALELYEVSEEQFENYLAKNIFENFSTLYTTDGTLNQNISLHVVNKVFQQVMGGRHKNKVAKIDKEIRRLSNEIELENAVVS